MKARKLNKVYKITEQEKEAYRAQGYDIIDDNGKLIETSIVATVPRAEHMKVVKELEDTRRELAETKEQLEDALAAVKPAKASKASKDGETGE